MVFSRWIEMIIQMAFMEFDLTEDLYFIYFQTTFTQFTLVSIFYLFIYFLLLIIINIKLVQELNVLFIYLSFVDQSSYFFK